MNLNLSIAQRYLEKLQMPPDFAPNLENLKKLLALHIRRIPFGNLNSFLGQEVVLAPEPLAIKLLDQGREGYCFEQNTLSAIALNELGYHAFNVLARVYYQSQPVEAPIRSHLVTVVQLTEHEWFLFDPGFGGMTPTTVLSLDQVGEVQTTPHEPYRIVLAEQSGLGSPALADMKYMLQAYVREEWVNLYALNPEQKAVPSDIQVANWFVSTSPESKFTQNLILSLIHNEARHNFINGKITIHAANASVKEELNSVEEFKQVFAGTFNLNIEHIDVEQLFQKLLDDNKM